MIQHQTVRNRQAMATRLDYIFLDNDHIQMCKKTVTKFGNSNHYLVWCSLYHNNETPRPTLWKLNPRMLENMFISKKIEAELMDENAFSDWDYYKNRCQSIYRACKLPTAPDTCIQKLYKRLTELNNKIAANPQLTNLNIVVIQLNTKLQDKLKLLTKKWQLISNVKWLVRNPETLELEDRLDILQYIRDQFEAIYQDEPVEAEAIEAITDDLLTVSQQQNRMLVKEFSIQEIKDTINKLPKL